MRRPWRILIGGAALGLVLAATLTPERSAALPESQGHHRFAWANGGLFERLEQRFDDARERDCDASAAAIDAGLRGLDDTLRQLGREPRAASDARFSTLEGQLFEVAPLFGGCLSRVPELIERAVRLRQVVKDESRAWNLGDRSQRDVLYRLIYGSRAAVEELLLAMSDPPGLVLGVDEPSRGPSVELHGVTLYSGDILLSRGGAPTSALIARGSDYPGNFSHVALLHVAEDGTATVLESHIESGVGESTPEAYLEDAKLRIAVLRLRADHPALRDRPNLPHEAAGGALLRARTRHIPYDFAMDYRDPSALFCSEVASEAYAAVGVTLWQDLSSMSSPGLTRWLASVGVRHFATQVPSDLEYDPQVRVVAEWRDPETLFADHVDNAILDVLLEGADGGDDLSYDYARLPLARVAKAYSVILNLFGRVGPVPEGMSATTGLRVEFLRERHGAVHEDLMRRIEQYRLEHRRRPPYWTLLRLARDAKRDVDLRGGDPTHL